MQHQQNLWLELWEDVKKNKLFFLLGLLVFVSLGILYIKKEVNSLPQYNIVFDVDYRQLLSQDDAIIASPVAKILFNNLYMRERLSYEDRDKIASFFIREYQLQDSALANVNPRFWQVTPIGIRVNVGAVVDKDAIAQDLANVRAKIIQREESYRGAVEGTILQGYLQSSHQEVQELDKLLQQDKSLNAEQRIALLERKGSLLESIRYYARQLQNFASYKEQPLAIYSSVNLIPKRTETIRGKLTIVMLASLLGLATLLVGRKIYTDAVNILNSKRCAAI